MSLTLLSPMALKASAETQSLKTGQTLTISLGGLRKDEAGLRFSNNDVNLMLVQKGSPVRNRPNYNGRIEVSSSSIQVLEVQVSDGGRYTLLDGKDREVKIITLKVTDPCASQIENMEVPYGHQLNIYLLSKIDSLGFTSVDKSQNYIIWSSSVHPKRGAVKGSGFDRNFIINSVNFEDQGDYTQSNNVRKVICVTKVKVVTSAHTQYCVAGEELTISFAGLSKDEVSLRFSKKDVNLMLVQQGSPVRNLTNYDNRIQVTSSSIQLLNVNVSDVGQYTIFDGKGREVKVISLELTEPGSWALLGIIVAVVLLCGVAGYCFKNFSTNPVQCQWQVQTTA
ncbi:uncharacterized protein [Salminus brasiliensis]|uniref:uncharacterized protein n=1 Tax=Salminus brasiliensis TaxID=930266 RepID=UPI003B839705